MDKKLPEDRLAELATEREYDRLTQLAEEQRPYDPGEPPLFKGPDRIEDIIFGKTADIMSKGLWTGLGIVAWPLQRLEYTVGTYATAALEARRKTMKERGVEKGFGIVQPRLLQKEEAKREHEEVVNALGLVGKAWIPGKEVPDGVKTFNEFFGSYYEAMTGEAAPGWYTQISGTGTSFLVTPYLFGKMLKGIWGGAKVTGIPQKIAARRLPAWQAMRRMARAQAGARGHRAHELGKSLGNREIRKLAKELSKQTGRKITPNAVRLRLTQIVKGSITTRPELAAKANPIIQEFTMAANELKQLGILPEHTYISKLPRKEITALIRKRRELQRQLGNLSKPPAQQQLLKLTEALHVKGAPQLASKLQAVARRIEKNTPKLGEKLARLVQNTAMSNEKLLDHLIRIEKATGTERDRLISRLTELATRGTTTKADTQNLATAIKQLEKSAPALSERLLKVLGSKTTEQEKLRDAIFKIAQKQSDEAEKLIAALDDLAGRAEVQEIAGLSKLLKKITTEQRRFPGRAEYGRKLQGQIDDITRRIHESYSLGGSGYFPRMYLTKEQEAAERMSRIRAANRIRAKYAIRRKDIPLDVRKEMGEILSPRGPVVKRLIQEGNDIELAKLIEWAARHPGWSSETWMPGFAHKALPGTKQYGKLAGMFVKQGIYDDLTGLIETKSGIGAAYDTFIGLWKTGKVTLSPSTHFRNMFSNSILLDLSGMDHLAQAKYMTKALQHIRKGSAEYNTAKNFFMRTTLVSAELFDDMLRVEKVKPGQTFRQVLNTINSFSGKGLKGPSEIYQAEEFIGKFMKYLQMRDKGYSVEAAVAEAEKWLFDYGDLSGFEKTVMRRLIPFYTFPRKALPRVLEAAATRPYTLAKYPMFAKSMMQTSLYSLHIEEKDWKYIEENLPSYMDNGSYILMPYRDANGDLRFFDWTYIVPWGEMYEAQERGLLKVGITNPLFQIVADLSRNKSGWTDRQIYDDAIPADKQTPAYRKEQNFKKLLYVWQALSPSLMYKGIYWDKLYGAATGKTASGKDMLLPETIAHTIFGARTQAIDPDEERRWRLLELTEGFDELRGNMIKIAMQRSRGDITEEEYDKKQRIYMEQLLEFHADVEEQHDDMPTTEEMLKAMESLEDSELEQPK